jgi:hypothetical protein
MHWAKHTCALIPAFMVVFWVFMFAFSRAFMLYSEYQAEVARLNDDAWLRVKCKDPEFFHNIKQHTDLCLKVEQNARKSCLLVALNTVASTTYLCGYRSCADYLTDAVLWVMGFGIPAVLLLSVCLLLFPTVLYPVYSSYLNRMADRRVMALYNAPYGMEHYSASHPRLAYPIVDDMGDAKKLV